MENGIPEDLTIRLVSDTINGEDITALCSWLSQKKTPLLTKGDLTIGLEEKWAKKVGTKYSVFVNSGSSAILLLLAAYKEFLGYNPKIVVPALSWATDVSSPMLLGYDVILCDCNLQDLSCDLTHLEYIFEHSNPKMFLLVSPLGFIPDMNKILKLCQKYNVVLIEDACESMGSRIGEKMIGSYGHSSVFSMYYGHHLSTIEGGFINTNHELLYKTIKAMRNHGWARDWTEWEKRDAARDWGVSTFESMYTFYHPGLNVRSTDLQAFIGLRMIDRLDEYSRKRNINFQQFYNKIKTNQLSLAYRKNEFISNFAYPMLHYDRERIVMELQKNSIEVRPLIAGSIGLQPFWITRYGKRSLPNADLVHKFGFYLPNHQDLTPEEIDRIIDIVNK